MSIISKRSYLTPSLKKNVFIVILFCVLVTSILLPISPLYRPVAGRDSTVFQYIGWQIIQGKVPYRDVWDHKPPLIYFIDAAALFISGNSSWGVWVFEWVNLFLVSWICYRLLSKRFGEIAGISSCLLMLLCVPRLISEGNLTTEFSIGLQFLSFWLFSNYWQTKSFNKAGFFMGLISGILFFLKQNLIGIFLSVVTIIFVSNIIKREWKKIFLEFFPIFIGVFVIFSVVIIYFLYNNALVDFWSAAFVYNFIYINTDMQSKVIALRNGLDLLTTTGLSIYAFIGWTITIFVLYKKKWMGLDIQEKYILTLAAINLPIELLLSIISGRMFPHYYLAWLSVFTILSAFTMYYFIQLLNNKKWKNWRMIILYPFAFFTLPFLTCITGYSGSFSPFMNIDISGQSDTLEIVKYVDENTSKDDYVLVLGAETGINLYSKRNSPSRYVYQYPLIKNGFSTGEMVNEFLNSIYRKEPSVIIDATSTNDAFTNGSVGEIKNVYNGKEFMQKVFTNQFITSHCILDKKIGEWDVYRCQS